MQIIKKAEQDTVEDKKKYNYSPRIWNCNYTESNKNKKKEQVMKKEEEENKEMKLQNKIQRMNLSQMKEKTKLQKLFIGSESTI